MLAVVSLPIQLRWKYLYRGTTLVITYSKTHAIPIEPNYVKAKSKLRIHSVSVTLVFGAPKLLSISHARLLHSDPIYIFILLFLKRVRTDEKVFKYQSNS